MHREYLDAWKTLAERVGIESARQFWDHAAHAPGSVPRVGRSSVMKGKHNEGKWPGYSKTINYEITDAGRIDYQYCDGSREGGLGDPHPVVKILTIDLGSH